MSATDLLAEPGQELDPLELLARDDKWYVSGGRALVYAPPFALHTERPGCWDAAHYLHFPVEPLYTYALVDPSGRELPLRFVGQRWRPDRLEVTFQGPGLHLTETRVMLPDDVLVSRLRLQADPQSERPLDLTLVAWTAQPMTEAVPLLQGEAGTATAGGPPTRPATYARDGLVLGVSRRITGARRRQLDLATALGLQGARSYSVNLAQGTANLPHFRLTPAAEKLGPQGLPGDEHLDGLDGSGLLYLALERSLHLEPGQATELSVCMAVNPELPAALAQARGALEHPDPVGAAETAWRAYFGRVPVFRCSDPYLEKYYYYRWYGLRLNTIDPQLGLYPHPVVCEGIGYFRVPISYSLQVLVREARWMTDPILAHGMLDTVMAAQTPAGTYPAHLYLDWRSDEELYHADWGGAFDAVEAVHPRTDAPEIYRSLSRYAAYFMRQRDSGGLGLYEIVNQWETGQEYMSRYFLADPQADLWQDMQFRLRGVDASTYLYRLFRSLARRARALGLNEAADWDRAADRTRSALRSRCWDPQAQAFFDLGPHGQRGSALSITGFYPYLTDIVQAEHLPGLKAHLLSPEEFWTPYPAPSSSRLDPAFSAEAEWKGKRHNCPWNGRTWPMTNSHVADLLGLQSGRDTSLRPVTADFITRFVHMLYEHHDLARPNCYEHYNPLTGHASQYRGIDDYMHSYVVDLLVRYLCGVQPGERRLRIDPFPFGVSYSLTGARVAGETLSVRGDASGYTVQWGGQVWSAGAGEALELPLGTAHPKPLQEEGARP